MYQLVTLIEDVGDIVEEHHLMEDTSICVSRAVYLHVEVHPVVCPGIYDAA
jgi:imidazoleglycerol phosphate dehydratase HisB